ncbi:hypothetical protein [Sporosarcina aquimarina]|uniref:Uncharacterized protein n=1 Tax=Sporosarcina aquimarina TaxID=114975 RepID=A0ABU4G0G9_9BACL|nr:hypothetical protein [Sporosarcina aquimarina]MDW0110457.1 hypothetical protein [Sporosarcina aquimarina]
MIIKYNPILITEDEHVMERANDAVKTIEDVDISSYKVDANTLARLFNEAEYKRFNDDAALRYAALKAKFIERMQGIE